MIYRIYKTQNRIKAFLPGEVAIDSASILAEIEARSQAEAIYLYVAELERQTKDQPTLLSLTQKLAERNAYLEQAITNHLATIEHIRAVVRSECDCTLKERMIEPS